MKAVMFLCLVGAAVMMVRAVWLGAWDEALFWLVFRLGSAAEERGT